MTYCHNYIRFSCKTHYRRKWDGPIPVCSNCQQPYINIEFRWGVPSKTDNKAWKIMKDKFKQN